MGDNTGSLGVSVPLGASTTVSDSFCWCEESVTTSVRSSDSSDVDLVLLLGRGMDRKFSVLTCGLTLSQLWAASL